MNDWTQLPKVIEGINWATRTFNNRNFAAAPQKTETPKQLKTEKKKPIIIEVMPWEPMPEGYTDYRPLLQRDGLILFSWEIFGDDIKIVWLSSGKKMFKYEAEIDDESELETINPEHRYNIHRRFYPGEIPDFIIYVAPHDLTINTKSVFIKRLQAVGVSVNFDYEFSLGKQKAVREMAVYDRIENSKHLTFDEAEFLEAYRQLNNDNKLEFIEYMKDLLIKQERNKTA